MRARTTLLFLAILASRALAQDAGRVEFAPGQVWRSAGVDGEPAIHFVVLETRSMTDVGRVVCIRMSGLGGAVPAGATAAVEAARTAVYPRAILRRHADGLVATLPLGLFPRFEFASWRAKQDGELNVQTLAPSLVARKAARLMRDVEHLEAKLPAYLPKKDAAAAPNAQGGAGPPVTVWIEVVERGSKVAGRLVGHKVEYFVGDTRCKDLGAMKGALAEWVATHAGKPRVIIAPGEHVVYGDVAPTVDAITGLGIEDVHIGDGRMRRTTTPAAKASIVAAPSYLAAGQVWSYRVPEGEKPHSLTVVHVEDVRGHGRIAFVHLGRSTAEAQSQPATWPDTVASWAPTLVRQLTRKVGTAEVATDPERVRRWRADFARGRTGYTTRGPWRMVLGYRALAARREDRLDLELPKVKNPAARRKE
ncbi:MAG: hypothetical protein H6837_19955 [Planctomycetes bacterium]|nr:hypothetical protein [Planctomycetota bacterium]